MFPTVVPLSGNTEATVYANGLVGIETPTGYVEITKSELAELIAFITV